MKKRDFEINYPDQKIAVFAEDEQGRYSLMETGSYMSKNYLSDFKHKQQHFIDKGLEKLRNMEISPVGYYTEIKEISPAEIAARTGLSRRKVRKHMKPEHFAKISIETAGRYADLFGIHISDLFSIKDSYKGEDNSEILNEYVKKISCKRESD